MSKFSKVERHKINVFKNSTFCTSHNQKFKNTIYDNIKNYKIFKDKYDKECAGPVH